ncbi:MAG: hypothetical protein PHE73_03620 [Sulfurovaceae bacterium]|nr:hypothetical protein [Sulfurovaceae bacterium]
MATILEEIDCEFVSSNVTDSTPLWDNTKNTAILAKAKLQYDKYIFLNNTPNPIIFSDYDPNYTYALGDISYKDGHVSIYSNGDGGISPKMPSEYAAHDASFDSSVWANRYVLLGTNTATYPEIALTATSTDSNIAISTVSNNGVYTYTCDIDSTSTGQIINTDTGLKNPTDFNSVGDGFTWSDFNSIRAKDGILATRNMLQGDTKKSATLLSLGYDFSSIPNNATIKGIEIQITRKSSGSRFQDVLVSLFNGITQKGINVASTNFWSSTLTTATYGGATNLLGWANITVSDLKSSDFGVGLSALNNSIYDSTAYLDSIQVKVYYEYVEAQAWAYSSSPTATNLVTSENVLTETKPTMHLDKSNYAYEFKSLIVSGTSIYARTDKDVGYETKTLEVIWEAVQSPAQLGMIYIGHSNRFAPFDDTNNTPAVFASPMTYVVKGLEDFNAFTLSKVLASSVTYTFKDPSGNVVKTATAAIDCKRDPGGILSLYPTTVVLYADTQMAPNSTIEITLTHDDDIKLGSFTVNNGVRKIFFTDLVFSKGSISYNNIQADEFGFIDKGNKPVVTSFNIKTHMILDNFRYSAPFLESIVDKWVTVDGADSWDGKTTFAPLVRRAVLGDHSISSVVENGELGDMVEATIMVKEII